MANHTTNHARRLSFQASWQADRGEQSFAQVIGPQPGTVVGTSYVHQPYMAVYIGGHDGVRVSIRAADTAEALAWLFAEAAARFRTACAAPNADDPSRPWDEKTFTAPPPDPDAENTPCTSQDTDRTTQPKTENPR